MKDEVIIFRLPRQLKGEVFAAMREMDCSASEYLRGLVAKDAAARSRRIARMKLKNK